MALERPVLTLDIDGVIAGGEYIPEWDRKPRVYEELPLLEPDIVPYINHLGRDWHIYLVSGRRFKGALQTTRRWVHEQINSSLLAGVIVWAYPPDVKARIVTEVLHSVVHVDDSPDMITAVEDAGGRGILKLNPSMADQWPGIREFVENKNGQDCVSTWAELMRLLEQYRQEWLTKNYPQMELDLR